MSLERRIFRPIQKKIFNNISGNFRRVVNFAFRLRREPAEIVDFQPPCGEDRTLLGANETCPPPPARSGWGRA